MRKLAAIMFTDIQGYTALMQQDEAQALLIRDTHRKHFERLTDTYGGTILQYYGDGTLSTFDSVRDAVCCAIDLQRAFRQAAPLPIPVRIGVHFGDVIFRDDDIIGDAVNLASRIECLGVSGNVLVSAKVANELNNQPDIKLVKLGSFAFKNVKKNMIVFAVANEGLYVPSPSELTTPPEEEWSIRKLPSFTNRFIGRQGQVAELTHLLLDPETRHITLLGPGGIGKTRLASQVGMQVLPKFKHGVCFVGLDKVEHAGLVPQYLAIQLGLLQQPDLSWEEQLISFLSDKQLLLLLDNMEQLTGAADIIHRLLLACDQIKIMATSRILLHTPLEIEYTLEAMELPKTSEQQSLSDLSANEAVALFLQKARTIRPSFKLTDQNAEDIALISRTLDGLPLAIELAAARIKLFSVSAILKQLDKPIESLRSRFGKGPERHQTIRRTIQWSFELLTEEEQRYFSALSLFPAGFTPDSLLAIFPEVDPLDLIESFLNQSLIRRGPELNFIPRFFMLRVIRDFAAEKLETYADHILYYERFADYYYNFAQANEPQLRGPEQALWVAVYEAEYENMQQALTWLRSRQAHRARAMGAYLWRYFLIRGLFREGLDLLRGLLDSQDEEDTIHLSLLEGAGTLAHNLGDYHVSKQYFEQCLKLCRSIAEPLKTARALNHLGWAEWRLGNYNHTLSYAEDALRIAEEEGDLANKARALNNQAWVAEYRGDYERAARLQRRVMEINRQLGHSRGIAFAQICLGSALLELGQFTEAEQLIDAGRVLFRKLKDRQLSAYASFIMARLRTEQERWSEAQAILLMECLPEFDQVGDKFGVRSSYGLLAQLALSFQQYDEGRRYIAKVREVSEKTCEAWGGMQSDILWGKLLRGTGDVAGASDYFDSCIGKAQDMDIYTFMAEACREKGEIFFEKKEWEPALRYLFIGRNHALHMGAYALSKYDRKIHPYTQKLRKELGAQVYQQLQMGVGNTKIIHNP